MWTFDDASRIGASDMDRRACPSYEAGFDARDPIGSVLEWSQRGPARVLRRRCRSEGIDRSPYEDAAMHNIPHHNRTVPNKSHFTLNTALETRFEKYRKECSLPTAENGDYIMAYDHKRHQSYQPGKSKLHKSSPTRSLLFASHSITKVEDGRLPKVEELFEKPDQDMMDVPVTKQPLKSILNNPIPKSPHGILKKPKSRPYVESKELVRSSDGRRRQRAASESDNLYQSICLSSPIPGYDRLSGNMKRAKDNTGGYSYGIAIASLGTTNKVKSPNSISRHLKNGHPNQQSAVPSKAPVQNTVNVLRTTAINNETTSEVTVIVVPREDTPTPTCPTVSPALPVSSETTIPAATKKAASKSGTVKKKPKAPKGKKMKSKVECASGEAEDAAGNASPSPEPTDNSWNMDTDALIAEIEKIDKAASPVKPAASPAIAASPVKPPPSPVVKKDETAPKLGRSLGTSTVKKVASQDKTESNAGAFVTALYTTNPFRSLQLNKDLPLNMPDSVVNCVRPSLFPRVPPYLKFINHDEFPSLKIPVPIQKHLKWKLTNITPIVVKKTLTNSGFRLVKSECDTSECPQEGTGLPSSGDNDETIDWIGIWGKHMKSIMFRAIKDGQKMNHFPGTFQIGRKDRLWRNLQKLATKHGVKEFGIMPKTYVLPHDLKLLKHDWEKHAENNEKWIIKPPASARGTGIKVVSRWTQIPKKRAVVVQRYISQPYLINGSKFDMRLYVLVTSVHPLRIYLYKDGLARFASVKYTNEITSLNDRYMHLTNYSINRLSKNYTPNEDFNACEGHKWTLQTLFQYLRNERNVDTVALWDSMKDLVIKTIISGEASISSLTKANVSSRYNCYELFGIDVLLDEDLKPWLLEVNISPSLHSASPLDIHVKGPLVTTVLNIAQYQVPTKTNLDMLVREKPHKLSGLPYDSRLYTIYLSKEERDKHIIYTNMDDRDLYLRDILSTLTSDDVRHLIQAEDELTQSGDMERVFPTSKTYSYLGFITGPRYYNRLFDAWETRYHVNREAGIQLLRNLCDIGYHLEVPPVPLKRAALQLSALDRCRMMWTCRHRLRRSARQCTPSLRWSQRLPRVPCPRRPIPVATSSRSRLLWRHPSNQRVHSITPRTLLATDTGSSESVHMDTITESQRKCGTSMEAFCVESHSDRNRNCAEMNESVAQSVNVLEPVEEHVVMSKQS